MPVYEIADLFPKYLIDIYEIKYLCKALDRGFSHMIWILESLVSGVVLEREERMSMSHWKKMFEDGDKLSNLDVINKLRARLAMDDNLNFEFITKYLDKKFSYRGHETSFDPDSMILTVKTPEVFYMREEAEKYLKEVVPCNIEIKVVAQ